MVSEGNLHKNISENFTFTTVNELKSFLSKYAINTSTWGQGSAKTIEHLLKELEEKEIQLSVKNGKVERFVRPLRVHVVYKDGADKYELAEQHQVFLDNGRMRERDTPGAIGEKMKFTELPQQALIRALQEELNITITGENTIEELPVVYRNSVDSGSYPGIISNHEIHPFIVQLTKEQYRPEGFVEVQKDKHNCFVWIKN